MLESSQCFGRRLLAPAVLACMPAERAVGASGDALQMTALGVFLAVSTVIVAVFLWVAGSTRSPRGADTAKAYRLRRVLFLSTVTAALIVLGFTLPRSPYAVGSAPADHLVHVTALSFAFIFSNEPITSLADMGNVPMVSDLSVPAGATIEFRVTSLDVNHSFAVFDQNGVLVGQTQAMPGYVNRLRLRFEKPGRYEVLCLEYCGLAHHAMSTAFNVFRP